MESLSSVQVALLTYQIPSPILSPPTAIDTRWLHLEWLLCLASTAGTRKKHIWVIRVHAWAIRHAARCTRQERGKRKPAASKPKSRAITFTFITSVTLSFTVLCQTTATVTARKNMRHNRHTCGQAQLRIERFWAILSALDRGVQPSSMRTPGRSAHKAPVGVRHTCVMHNSLALNTIMLLARVRTVAVGLDFTSTSRRVHHTLRLVLDKRHVSIGPYSVHLLAYRVTKEICLTKFADKRSCIPLEMVESWTTQHAALGLSSF